MKNGGIGLRARFAFFVVIALSFYPFMLAAFEPKPQNSTLQVGNNTLQLVEVINSWRTIHVIGTNRFFVTETAVQRRAPTGQAFAWTTRSDDGSALEWLGATTNTAYLLGFKSDEYKTRVYDSPPRIRRLDLATGKWLPDLAIPAPSNEFETKSVLELLSGPDNRVAILTGLIKRSSSEKERTTIEAYDLCIFNDRETKPLWTRQFLSGGERAYTGGYLWGIPRPQYAGSKLHSLTWLGDRLLVCPEAMQPIYCLNPDTGSEIWHVERLWELQRGFVGPSVWSHYIGRFGIEEYELNKTNVSEGRKVFDQQFQCALAGGPAIVPINFERRGDAHSVFIATVKGPAKQWSGYLSDCVIYELNDDGKPVSMGTLPQMADGSDFCTREGDVIWKCQHETFVKLGPSRQPIEVSMGGGNSDGIFNLVWTRRVLYEPPKAWLNAGKSGDPTAFGDSWVYCIPGGGYVLRKGEKQFHFPVAAVNLSTGEDTVLDLTVPFEGEIALPDSNIGTETSSDGSEYHTALNPLALAATWLEACGNELDITLATESNKWTVCFDVGEALSTALRIKAPQTNHPALNEIEPMRELRTQKDKDLCLQDFAKGNDTNTVIVVLKAGANPKYSSDLGWTALMVAAAYGTADMVDLLIAAGSDMNAADKNCGGQTILMWAARSQREAKQKVRSLLKAGARLNASSNFGYNALMSAASEGDLEVVEYLIQAGADISSRDQDGETVLMAGARSGNGNVISALIKAGAQINVTDKAGMTALMHAADSVNAAGAVEVLLKSGANPKLKDKKGRTALAIAQKSNTVGSEEVVKILKALAE